MYMFYMSFQTPVIETSSIYAEAYELPTIFDSYFSRNGKNYFITVNN